MLLVNNASGEKCFCFGGRKLNSITKPDAYALRRVDSILNMLTGAKCLSSIDVKSTI